MASLILALLFIFQVHECGVSVSCLSLEGQLGKLEVMGSRAIELLQKILRPTSKYVSSLIYFGLLGAL